MVGELVKRCRLFCGGSFRPHPRVTRIIGHVRQMIGNKLLQCECARARISAAGCEGRGLQRSSFSQQARALSRVNLIGSQHVEAGVRMHVVIPRIELAEVVFGFGLARKAAWEDRMGFDGSKVRLDVRVVIGLSLIHI